MIEIALDIALREFLIDIEGATQFLLRMLLLLLSLNPVQVGGGCAGGRGWGVRVWV